MLVCGYMCHAVGCVDVQREDCSGERFLDTRENDLVVEDLDGSCSGTHFLVNATRPSVELDRIFTKGGILDGLFVGGVRLGEGLSKASLSFNQTMYFFY